jgi:predicted RNA binding protein YcfA (HicA-like mRNA interferase family)
LAIGGRLIVNGQSHCPSLSIPPKIRELIALLVQAGFSDRGGKSSHRDFTHPRCSMPVTLAGNPGDDAKRYQIRQVEAAIRETKNEAN